MHAEEVQYNQNLLIAPEQPSDKFGFSEELDDKIEFGFSVIYLVPERDSNITFAYCYTT